MKPLVPRDVLEGKLRHHHRWYWINRLFRDYSQAISLVISISIPTCLLLIPSLPPDHQKFVSDLLLIITLIGLLLSLSRSIFRFEERTRHNGKLLKYVRHVALNYDNNKLSDEDLIKEIEKIEEEEEKELEID